MQEAVTGVFLSADPTIPAPGNTMNYHHIVYANHNPLTYTDPTGFSVAPFCKDWCPNENNDYYLSGWGGTGAGPIVSLFGSPSVANDGTVSFDDPESSPPAQISSDEAQDQSDTDEGTNDTARGFGSDPGFANSSTDEISEIIVTANAVPPPDVPQPPDNIPGGPWQWSDDAQNSRGGVFQGQKPAKGPRPTLTWSPPTAQQRGYWKRNPSGGGPVQRYYKWGAPMPYGMKEWGTSPFDFPSIPPVSPWAFFIYGITHSSPAY